MIFSRPISSISAACLYSLALVQLPLLLLLLWVQAATCRSALYNTSSSRLNAKLNVHIISHTHNDPGWLHSYAQYHRPLELNGRVIGEHQTRYVQRVRTIWSSICRRRYMYWQQQLGMPRLLSAWSWRIVTHPVTSLAQLDVPFVAGSCR
jgi:hypothetical protein